MLKVCFGGDCGLVFENVLVCVFDFFVLDMYIDIDEVNVVGVCNGDIVEIID